MLPFPTLIYIANYALKGAIKIDRSFSGPGPAPCGSLMRSIKSQSRKDTMLHPRQHHGARRHSSGILRPLTAFALAYHSQLTMRVAAAAIYFFDYLMTLPRYLDFIPYRTMHTDAASSEYRIYKRQKKLWNPSAACILFVLCRYITLVSIIMATAFFFGTNWTAQTCVPAVLVPLSASVVSRKLTSFAAAERFGR
jgi:hypothetical protein